MIGKCDGEKRGLGATRVAGKKGPPRVRFGATAEKKGKEL